MQKNNNPDKRIIIAGSGGQGILLLGRLISYIAMLSGMNVTWFPSYGAEMRGGTANCSVVVSKNRIGSPLVTTTDILVVMNCPSLKRFLPRVIQGGTVIYDSSMISDEKCGTDHFSRLSLYNTVGIKASEEAIRMGSIKFANMFLLGAFLATTFNSIDQQLLKLSFEKTLSKRHHRSIPKNIEAVLEGFRLAQKSADF
ncbi:MAG: 2-oxoacid:ferredoxin oxidoreductase subunit gamma [Nitrospirae bacterium]|nr:2-oxoacid:ferredoxin oxidoreductase subunit gamma [Nitrospirota bacterium]